MRRVCGTSNSISPSSVRRCRWSEPLWRLAHSSGALRPEMLVDRLARLPLPGRQQPRRMRSADIPRRTPALVRACPSPTKVLSVNSRSSLPVDVGVLFLGDFRTSPSQP
jgi:hypothetical protein